MKHWKNYLVEVPTLPEPEPEQTTLEETVPETPEVSTNSASISTNTETNDTPNEDMTTCSTCGETYYRSELNEYGHCELCVIELGEERE